MLNYKSILISLFTLFLFTGCVSNGEFILNESVAVNLVDMDGNDNSVQYPQSTNGDWFYFKDIDSGDSLIGNFNKSNISSTKTTFELLTTDLSEGIIDNSTSATKILFIDLERTQNARFIGLGCDIVNKSFSNVKIELLGSGGAVRELIDISNDDAKRTSFTPEFPATFFNSVRLTFETIDEICLTNLNFQKIISTNSKFIYSSNNVDRHFLKFDTAITTLNTSAAINDFSLDVVSTIGFSVGDSLLILSPGKSEIDDLEITAISGGVITLDRPLDNVYVIGTTVERVVKNMAVVGSLLNPQIFQVCPPSGEVWTIYRIMINILDNQDSDLSKLGGITGGITNGIVIRTNKSGILRTISNWDTAADMQLDMMDVEFPDKTGGGLYSTIGRYSFIKQGFTPLLNGDTGDCLQALVQDPLTDFTSMDMKAHGEAIIRN